MAMCVGLALGITSACDPYKFVVMGDAGETAGSLSGGAGGKTHGFGAGGRGGSKSAGAAGAAGAPARPCSVAECGPIATLVVELSDEWMAGGWSIEVCFNAECLKSPLAVPSGNVDGQTVARVSLDADPTGFSAATVLGRPGAATRLTTAISLLQDESHTRLNNGDRFSVAVIDATGTTRASTQKTASYSVQRAECTNCLKANLFNVPQIGTRRKVTQVATTLSHACAIADNKVYCWGENSWKNLGDGTTEQRGEPILVNSLPGTPSAIALGADHSCAMTTEGLFCWGESDKGLFSSPTKSGPDGAPSGSAVAPLAAVFGATCAKVSDSVACWGNANYNPTVSIEPVALSGLYGHFCAVSSAGAAYCWREVLLGVSEGRAPPIVTVTEGLTANVTAISAGRNQSCAVMAGEAYCWGLNTYGMLGDGSTEERYVPVKVIGLPGRVDQISTGLDSTCATVEGAVYCWGNNNYGQLGNGTTFESLTPVELPGFGSGARAVSVGYAFACAIVDDRLYCWGRGSSASLGYTSELASCLTLPCSPSPREVLFP